MNFKYLIVPAIIIAVVFATKQGFTTNTQEPVVNKPEVKEQENKETFTEDYEKAMQEKNRKVIVIFKTEWCVYCDILEKHLKETNLEGYLVCYVNATEHRDLKRKYGVKIFPTSIMMKDGKETSREIGFKKEKYNEWLSKNR